MNKRFFFITITTVIVAFMTLSVNAHNAINKYWNDSSPYTFTETAGTAFPKTTLSLQEDEVWWGYFKGNFGISDPSTWHYAGYFSECVYSCAIKINAENVYGMGTGKTIEGLRFPIAELTDIDNVKVWISTELPSGKYSEDADINYINIDKSTLVDGVSSDGTNFINEIRFNKPYTIADKDVYVGYSFEITQKTGKYSNTPVVCTNTPEDFITLNDAFYMKFNKGKWEDQKDYGEVLSMQVLLSGDIKKNAVNINPSFENIAVIKNQEYKVPCTLMNIGNNDVKSISYVVKANGVTTDEKTIQLDNPVNGIGTSFELELAAKAPADAQIYNLEIELTQINGMPNEAGNVKSTSQLITTSKKAARKVFIEDYASLNDGYSPINFINAEKTKQMFGNDVVFVSVHPENDDPLYCADYESYLTNNQTGSVPECNIDRTLFELTPYDGTYTGEETHFGFGDDIVYAQNFAAVAEIAATAKLSEDKKAIEASASTTFLFNGTKNDYALAYILKEGGMSDENWIQLNDYYEYAGCGMEDEEPLYDKWVNGTAEMKGLVFDDIVIAGIGIENGIDGSISSNIKDGEVQTHNVTFNLADYPIIQNAENLSLCVVLIDRATGKVVNSDCFALNGADENSTYTDLELKDNELWWGLFKGDFGDSDPYNWHKVGYGSTLTYGCCMKLHADNIYDMGKGKTIEGVSFAFPDYKNIDNVKVWMSTHLPEEASAEDADLCYMSLEKSKLVDAMSSNGGTYINEVRFEKPYTIGDNDVYIGYTFDMLKVDDSYDQTPVACVEKPEKMLDYKDAFYMRWDDFKWQSQEFDKETLCIQLLMSGEFKNNDVKTGGEFSDIICEKDAEVNIPIDVMNLGRNGISSIGYNVISNGKEIANNTLSLDTLITYIGDNVKCMIPVKSDSKAVAADIKVNINQINGIDIEGNNNCCGQVITVDKRADRRVLLEDYTANWSGASAIGIVNIERAVANFNDTIVPIAIHLTKDDPMTNKHFTKDLKNIKSVPASMLNRNNVNLYPYFGSDEGDEFRFGYGDDIRKEINKLTVGEINVEAQLSEDKSTIKAVSYTTFNFTGCKSNYAIGYILTENGMHSEDWMQENSYTDLVGEGFEDFEPFLDRWINGEEQMNIEFNNVLVADLGGHNGLDNSVETSIENGKVQENTVIFSLADYPIIQNPDNITVCVLLIDRNTGEVLNVAMDAVKNNNLGIHDTSLNSDFEKIRYNVDGTRSSANAKGINIIKYGNGSVRKVITR